MAYVLKLEGCLPPTPRQGLPAGPEGTPTHKGSQTGPQTPFPSKVNDNWALEAGACQEVLSQNVSLLSLANF